MQDLKESARNFDDLEDSIFADERGYAQHELREIVDTLLSLDIPPEVSVSVVNSGVSKGSVSESKELFYIKNTVNEYSTCINGYFSTFDKAQAALKNCEDWYRSKGTGRIYRVDMDKLDPIPELICKDGIIEPEFIQEYGPQFNLNSIVTDEQGHRARVMAYDSENNKYQLLFVDPENISKDGWYSAEQIMPYENKREGLDSLINQAKDISEQGKVLAENLGKFKASIEPTR